MPGQAAPPRLPSMRPATGFAWAWWIEGKGRTEHSQMSLLIEQTARGGGGRNKGTMAETKISTIRAIELGTSQKSSGQPELHLEDAFICLWSSRPESLARSVRPERPGVVLATDGVETGCERQIVD
jgi:hypothetical protein